MRAFLALAGAVLLAACGQAPGRMFPVSIESARATLLKTEPPGFVFGSSGASLTSLATAENPEKIVWKVSRKGAELMRFTADLSAVDAARTRVHIGLEGPPSGPNVSVGKKLDENKTVRKLYVVAMEEAVASEIEQRPFEMAKIYPAMMAATAANLSMFSDSVDQAAAADRQRSRDNIAKAYAEEEARRY